MGVRMCVMWWTVAVCMTSEVGGLEKARHEGFTWMKRHLYVVLYLSEPESKKKLIDFIFNQKNKRYTKKQQLKFLLLLFSIFMSPLNNNAKKFGRHKISSLYFHLLIFIPTIMCHLQHYFIHFHLVFILFWTTKTQTTSKEKKQKYERRRGETCKTH